MDTFVEKEIVEALISDSPEQKQAALTRAYEALTSSEYVANQHAHFAWRT